VSSLKAKCSSCLLLVLILLAGCNGFRGQPSATGESSEPVTLIVFAAASLTDAFTEIKESFEDANAGVSVVLNFAGSNQLATQINGGAPADLFASANERQMGVAVEGGRIDSESPQTFVTNRLVVAYPADNPGRISQLQDLARPGTLLVLASEQVPVGQYSLEFLKKSVQDSDFSPSFQAEVLGNVVSYEENVRAVLNKVTLGEADAGIVYTSDLAGLEESEIGRLEIPDTLNSIAVYPIAPLNDSENSETARAFIDFVLSSVGQEILARYGFGPPE
jgi:molybdate transport system substrate-binding protein